MDEISKYRLIATDNEGRSIYNDYQQRYASQIKESDKFLLSLVADLYRGQEDFSILDIGCSTGNFLGHLSQAFPKINLFGGDLAESSLDYARQAVPKAKLSKMDLLAIPTAVKFDLIIANAVTFYLTLAEYRQAMKSVAAALKPTGTYLALEYIHPFDDQYIEIVEVTPAYPDGLKMYLRPYNVVEAAMSDAGLSQVKFFPFNIGIDLPQQPMHEGMMLSHTIKAEDGTRACFRGAMYQPWCFVSASLDH